jgi:hypothetical protein
VVLVPALVKTNSGETVFSLAADDFILKDNGVPQTLRLETDTDSQPLALVVIVETGGQGTWHLHDYENLGSELDAVIGDVGISSPWSASTANLESHRISPIIRMPQQKRLPT